MIPRNVPLRATKPLARTTGLARAPFARTVPLSSPGTARTREASAKSAARTDPIPPKARALVHARDGHWCIRCGGCFPDGIELHHRRIKGIGGSTAEHAHCACVLVSLCGGPWGCHRHVHLNRPLAEAEGLIVPRPAEFPFLYSVLVHGRMDAGGVKAWPACSGEWLTDEPEGAVT